MATVQTTHCEAVLAPLKPLTDQAVYRLVEAAGVDLTPWRTSKKDGRPIKPEDNVYRNSRWGFGGGSQPIVLCIWWRDLDCEGDNPIHASNMKDFRTLMANELARAERDSEEKDRLRGKIEKSQEVETLIGEAFRHRKPVQFILLDGKKTEREAAATESSKPDVRKLDEIPWFVHEYDPFTGDFKFVRGIPRVATPNEGAFPDVDDPADDPEFRRILEDNTLSQTEKDALTKLRVAQGWFRDQLIKRWGGCSVTQCVDSSLLIASHIVPWRLCKTRLDRLTPANGLLLTPNLDKLFDKGLITFDDNFKIVFSSKLGPATASYLGVLPASQLRKKEFSDIRPYLQRHREEIFQQPSLRR